MKDAEALDFRIDFALVVGLPYVRIVPGGEYFVILVVVEVE